MSLPGLVAHALALPLAVGVTRLPALVALARVVLAARKTPRRNGRKQLKQQSLLVRSKPSAPAKSQVHGRATEASALLLPPLVLVVLMVSSTAIPTKSPSAISQKPCSVVLLPIVSPTAHAPSRAVEKSASLPMVATHALHPLVQEASAHAAVASSTGSEAAPNPVAVQEAMMEKKAAVEVPAH